MLTLDADIEGFLAEVEQLDRALATGLQGAVGKAVEAGQNEARTNHRFTSRTNTLTDNTKGRVTATTAHGAEGVLESTAPYAAAVNDGSQAHVIQARNAQALAFEKDGETVFARAVQHPGTAADPFFDRGVAKTETVLVAEVEKALDKLVG